MSLLGCTSHGQDQSPRNADKGCKHTEFLAHFKHTDCCSCTQQSPEHWALNKQTYKTKQTSTATSNSLPTVNKAEKGVAKQFVQHHSTSSKHHRASGPPPHFRSLSHDMHLFSLSTGFCDPVVNHNPLGWSPGISRQLSPEKMRILSLQTLPDPKRPDEIRLQQD